MGEIKPLWRFDTDARHSSIATFFVVESIRLHASPRASQSKPMQAPAWPGHPRPESPLRAQTARTQMPNAHIRFGSGGPSMPKP